MRLVLLVVFFATVAQAGNRTMCNNTYVLADSPTVIVSVAYTPIAYTNLQNDVNDCVRGGPCPLCGVGSTDFSNKAAVNQGWFLKFAQFFDENDCWGQILRLYPDWDPWTTVPSKQDFIRTHVKAGCNATYINCAFAYLESYCPSCPVTQAQLDNEKDEMLKMRNVAIAVSVVAFVVGIGLGSICGARAQAMSAKAQQQREEGTNVSSSEINLRPVVKSPRRTSSQSRV